MNWNAGNIEALKNKGLKVKFSAPLSKDRTVEVISNGKKETVKIRKEMQHEESLLQQNCVKTFRLMYPAYKFNFFSIPNEGIRTYGNASRMLSMGMLPGASDTLLTVPKGKWHGAFFEFKITGGGLSQYQVQFIKAHTDNYYCSIIRSVEQFLSEVNQYLSIP